MSTVALNKTTVRSFVSVPPVQLRVEISEELGFVNLIAYRLPNEDLMGHLSWDTSSFGGGVSDADRKMIARALSIAFRTHSMIGEGYERILRDHENWYSVRRLLNSYLMEGEKLT